MVPLAGAVQAATEETITVDVADDGRTFDYNRGIPLAQIVRGDGFIISGKIFAAGTLRPGTQSNDPNDPGSIGNWLARGTSTGSLAEHLANPTSPAIFWSQYLMLNNGMLVSEGWFAPSGANEAALIAGTRAFRGASGELRSGPRHKRHRRPECPPYDHSRKAGGQVAFWPGCCGVHGVLHFFLVFSGLLQRPWSKLGGHFKRWRCYMMTFKTYTPVLMTLGLMLGLRDRTFAGPPALGTFFTIDFPGASSTGGSPPMFRFKINPEGQIVGRYQDTSGKGHGFFLSKGSFTTIDFPGAISTWLNAINPEGDIVANYQDASLQIHGFLLSKGNLSTVDFPGATLTAPFGINPKGDIAGAYVDTGGSVHGFLLSQGAFTPIDFPGATFTPAQGINAEGRIVGAHGDAAGKVHGYLLSNGTFTSIDVPGATLTSAIDISPEGDIVGTYNTADGKTHGYLLTGGQFRTIDVPGGVFSFASGINPEGKIVGKYETADGRFHGFLLE